MILERPNLVTISINNRATCCITSCIPYSSKVTRRDRKSLRRIRHHKKSMRYSHFGFLVTKVKGDSPQNSVDDKSIDGKLRVSEKNESYDHKTNCEAFDSTHQRRPHVDGKLFSGDFVFYKSVLGPKSCWAQLPNVEKKRPQT